ncbi:hypothetical protein AB6A40_004428 [Gnathostoma spinigerum]|uniref:Uncharacterized protein n=1 Tax=Gnathostoma spinigerum TaxID=75299 RepID=A0ABD6EK42_9BILA
MESLIGESAVPSTSREKNKLSVSNQSSLFALKGEFERKKLQQKEKSLRPSSAKKNPLLVTKEEQRALDAERKRRKERIESLEKEIQKEEEERIRAQKILEEKSRIYDRLTGGESVTYGDGETIEFMVDFDAKKRNEDQKRHEEEEREKRAREENIAEHFNPYAEQRVYGPSHIVFSVDEDKRREQLDDLVKMSKETEKQREASRKTHDIREKLKNERLNKIRRRKGLPEVEYHDHTEETEESLTFLDIPLPQGEEPLLKADRTKIDDRIREWDRGKVAYTKWINAQREERNEEFRPPSSYYR